MRLSVGARTPVPLDTWQRRAVCIAIVFVATLLFLWLNHYPIIIGDSTRYTPAAHPRAVGAILPRLLFTPAFWYYGDWGSALTGAIAAAYGVGRLMSVVSARLELRLLPTAAAALAASIISLVPVYAVMIATEPFSVAYFGLLLAVLVSGRVSWWFDLPLLLVLSGTHPSHVPVTLGVLLFALVVLPVRKPALTAVLAAAALGGLALDKAAYDKVGPDSPRISMSFLGATLLSNYPFVLEHRCARDPDFLLCDRHYRAHIERYGHPGAYVGQLLWYSGSMFSFVRTSKLEKRYRLSIDQYEDASKELVLEFLRAAPSNIGAVVDTAARRTLQIFTAPPETHLRPRPPRFSWRNSAFRGSICGKGACSTPAAALIHQIVVYSQYVLALIVSVLVMRAYPSLQWGRITLLFVGTYLINAFFLANLSVPAARYIYKILFLISIIAAFGLARLATRERAGAAQVPAASAA